MNILLYGSAYPTAIAERALLAYGYDVIGHVPCTNPSFPGSMMSSQVAPEDVWTKHYDLALSIFYDRKVIRLDKAYNIHPGLLPRWAGCDILYHTIKEQARVQGLTLHRMTQDFDRGPIVSQITYPVYKGDRIVDLYKRACALMPGFARSSVSLIRTLGFLYPPPPAPEEIQYYKRGLIEDHDLYNEAREEIRAWVETQP